MAIKLKVLTKSNLDVNKLLDHEEHINDIDPHGSTRFTAEDGRRLHSAFLAAHFGTSPRLGSEPTIIKATKQALMSFLETTQRRAYSFVTTLDAAKQQITVVSYKLSRYDRLM